MFWNVENFFDPFNDPLTNDEEFTPAGAKHWTWSRFIEKRNGIGKTILAVADQTGSLPILIGLSEVENSLVLKQLVKDSPLSEAADYGFVHKDSPDARGIDVALLYDRQAFQILDTLFIRTDEFATRDILYTKGLYSPSKDTLNIFVCHFPSKRGGGRRSQPHRDIITRLLEYHLDSLKKVLKSPKIVVMGDFNDEAITLSIPEVPTDGGTLKYHGRWEKIDHIFTSDILSSDADAFIFSPPFLLEDDKSYLGKKPKRTYIGPRYNKGLSDHLPVVLKLDLLE